MPEQKMSQKSLGAINDGNKADASSQMQQANNPIRSIINRRMKALQRAAVDLAGKAEQFTRHSRTTKLALIFLGAFVTTREVAARIPGLPDIAITLIYALTGLCIATLAGMEAYFQWEKRAQQLGVLAVRSRESRQKFDTELAMIDIKQSSYDEKIAAEQELLTRLDEIYFEIQKQASELKINVVLEIVAPDSKRS